MGTPNFPSPSLRKLPVAVIGSGPTGLMAAYVLASAGVPVTIFEKRKATGRKLLIAGSSGLNISYDCPDSELPAHYRGPEGRFKEFFAAFSRANWLRFVEGLGLETFKGTSRRYFVREMKASGLLRAWMEKLRELGVVFELGQEVLDFDTSPPRLRLASGDWREFAAVIFALGGGSWEPEGSRLRWPETFVAKGLGFKEFVSSNSGFKVAWPDKFLKEAEGLPLKNIALTTSRGSRKGELVVTAYGLEGTPVYAIGQAERVFVDLKPDLSEREIAERLTAPQKENLAPMRRVKKLLRLCEGSEALLFHLSTPKDRADGRALAKLLKRLPIELGERAPLSEAISSSGGLEWAELDARLMIKRYPGVFAAGEMLDWDAPTGGFLIQGCVSQGVYVGHQILEYLRETS